MDKNSAKKKKPQTRRLPKHSPSNSLKENTSKPIIPAIDLQDSNRNSSWFDTAKTKRPSTRTAYESLQINKNALTDCNRQTRKNITKIKDSIKEILDESVKVSSEIHRLRGRFETNLSSREHSQSFKKPQIEFDVSSIKSSPALDPCYQMQMTELKQQLNQMNERLLDGEEKLKTKALENYGLQYTVFSLQHKLEKIRKKSQRSAIEHSKCRPCLLF